MNFVLTGGPRWLQKNNVSFMAQLAVGETATQGSLLTLSQLTGRFQMKSMTGFAETVWPL